MGGIISCGSTHTMVVPLDLVKCRLQVDAAKYKLVKDVELNKNYEFKNVINLDLK